jgi:C4-type Zn-finger protein
MCCPLCGNDMEYVSSRIFGNGYIFYFVCMKCGHRVEVNK